MPRSKPRKKAAAKKKKQRREFHAAAGARDLEVEGAPQGTWDDDAHELLTARGWVAYRDLGMDQLGDGWEWLPSQLPLDAGVGGEPGPTSVFAAAEGGYDVELANSSGTVDPDRAGHYDTLGALAADLDDLEAWRVPADEYVLSASPAFSAGTPWEICQLYAGGMIDHWELAADLIHFPYEETEERFAAVERAHGAGLVPTSLFTAIVAGRAAQRGPDPLSAPGAGRSVAQDHHPAEEPRSAMTETTPDPAENKPSQAEGAPEDENLESAVDPAENKPSQAEGDAPENPPGS